MSLDPQLVEILACPDTHHAPLDYDPEAETLTCPQCRRVFEVRDGIPVLLLDEARTPADGGAGQPADGGAGQPADGGAGQPAGGGAGQFAGGEARQPADSGAGQSGDGA